MVAGLPFAHKEQPLGERRLLLVEYVCDIDGRVTLTLRIHFTRLPNRLNAANGL